MVRVTSGIKMLTLYTLDWHLSQGRRLTYYLLCRCLCSQDSRRGAGGSSDNRLTVDSQERQQQQPDRLECNQPGTHTVHAATSVT